MRIKFNNSWYPSLVIFSITFSIIVQILNLMAQKELLNWILLTINLIAILCLIFSEKSIARVSTKVWAGVMFIGGLLGLFSVISFLIIGRYEGNIETCTLVRDMLHFTIGLIIFRYWDKSIVDSDVLGVSK